MQILLNLKWKNVFTNNVSKYKLLCKMISHGVNSSNWFTYIVSMFLIIIGAAWFIKFLTITAL